MKSVIKGRRLLCAFLLLILPLLPSMGWAAPPPDYRFKAEVLTSGMPQPMELELAPDGRIFFNEIQGKLKIYKPDTHAVVEAGHLEVFSDQESGLLGFALDPDFASNQWIYLLYSPKDFSGQRLSRFKMMGDQLDRSSERQLLQFEEQRRECCHHAGSVEFGPDGNLYFSTGDNTNPGGDSNGYAPIDERPDHFPRDAQKSASNTADLRGKIVRIRPTPEGGYTIPSGNLFSADGSQGRPEIYVMGCRNPWRISLDEQTGILYWGEVGPDAGGDGPRGPRGYDEINQARQAGNFGWPYFVGKNFAYADVDFQTGQLGAKFDPQRPINESPNNTGSRILPPAQPAFIYWPYGASPDFPALGSGGRTACAGPVFHYRPHFRETGGFPEYFDRCLLFYDWQRPFIKWARLDAESNLEGIEPFTAAVHVANDPRVANEAEANGEFVLRRPIDMQFGPDGCLYLLDYGETWGANHDTKLVRISYQYGNLPPVAVAAASSRAGREPLRLELDSAGSRDPEGEPVTVQWFLHPGAKKLSEEAKAKITIDTPGNYVIELRVRDVQGGTSSTSLPLQVGNSPPQLSFVEPLEGDFFTPGQPLHFRLRVQDLEDGDSKNFEELMESRTFVTAQWDRGDAAKSEIDPGLAMMQRSDCFNCHAIDQKIVGPPLLEVANRYRDMTGALDASAQRVRQGSSGVWGEVPMLPHEQFSLDQIKTMVQWVYRLQPGQSDSRQTRGLNGEVATPKEQPLRGGTLEAVYTDAGRLPAGSLTGHAVVHLRSRRLPARTAETIHGPQVLGHFVGAIDDGHFLKFDHVNMTGAGSITARVASAGAGASMEFHSGSVSGPLLAALEVKPTGGWEKWVELTAPLQSSAERTDLFVVFHNPGRGGLMNLDWFTVNP